MPRTAAVQTAETPAHPIPHECAQALPDHPGTAAALVGCAWAGVVLLPEHGVLRLPGLPDDELLQPGSALLAAARDAISDGANHTAFLWPRSGTVAPDDFVRATVTACDRAVDTVACGVVVLSPATGLRGLTPRELEVLGHLVEGCSNHEIARALAVTPRTVAAHVEHILVKLNATSRTLAAVRAERAGLYIPLTAAALL
ncbi:response regulator transcription factor [Curtobacterium luteum]|uniref:helix-turn-helix transcriptional regulator n=1 Tax=Curtobacterium luteum TaxID=33881 RepID=UPI0038098BBD